MRFAKVCVIVMLTVGCKGSSSAPPDGSDAQGAADTRKGAEFDGVYCTPAEISGFSGTILELKGGEFRYWFYSDLSFGDSPEYPLEGKYVRDGEKLQLVNEQVRQTEWFPDMVNGIRILWRDDALKHWRENKKIYDYGVLIKVVGSVGADGEIERPSVRELYDAVSRGKTWKDPYVHGPQ